MVRCADCGFLAVRNPETESLEAVDEEAREEGNFPSANLGRMLLGLAPRCFRIASDLGAECKEAKEKDGNREPDARKIYLAVITKERTCSEFTEWHPGFTPKEHREMLFDLERKKLEMQEKENERQWEERREQCNRRFQLANTLISALAGAIFTAIIGGIAAVWAGRSDTKPTIIVQPNQPEKTSAKPQP